MDRRSLISSGAGLMLGGLASRLSFPLQASDEKQASDQGTGRHPVLVRSGFTRETDGTNQRAPSPSGMFDTEVVRASDSDGRLAAYVFPVGDHHPYSGAPLHVHHQQDEWLYILAGEFVAEIGGKRMRLRPGDALLMPMKVPHRWTVAQDAHCGAIHLYSPAGLIEIDWSPVARNEDPSNLEARKAEFEKHGLSLLGGHLRKEEIDNTV